MNLSELLRQLKRYLRSILDPSADRESEADTIENIRKGIDFKGSNLWVLIFAIFIASLGLNVNSTAVIIGAMLISPLMGPIMGVGLGVGINDFELIKKSFRNLAIATIFGILTSTLYFLLSPLNEARSELLARTTPTIYDVLIAFFGGMAGIVASSTRLKGNVIPGVAIATALMPPLCTAGFGIASGNFSYFFGAFYLYMINSVFIAFATTLGVKLMHFTPKVFVDKEREKKVHQLVYTIIFLTIIPSVYITYNMIRDNFFETGAQRFIAHEIHFPNTVIIDRKIDVEGPERSISVSVIGEEIPAASIALLREKLANYGLRNAKLNITQGLNGKQNDNELSSMMLKDFYRENQKKMTRQEEELTSLRERMQQYAQYDSISAVIGPEIKVLFPHVRSIAVSCMLQSNLDSTMSDTVTVALVEYRQQPQPGDEQKFRAWLITRLRTDQLEIIQKP